jgi:hypothetical protein
LQCLAVDLVTRGERQLVDVVDVFGELVSREVGCGVFA